MDEPEKDHCVLCGRSLRRPLYVNVDAQTMTPIPLDAQPEHGEYGAILVGPECVKKFGIPKTWISKDSPYGGIPPSSRR